MNHIQRIFDIPYHQLKSFPKADCLCDKRNGKWIPVSTSEFIESAESLASALIEMNVRPGDRIATITTTNRSEWNITDLAISLCGAINVPVYPTISADDYEYIFNHAEVTFCFISDSELFAKVIQVKDRVPTLKGIYGFSDISGCENYRALITKGKSLHLKEEIERRKSGVKSGDLCTIIYTSGTTGKPKGVMLSHGNLVSNALNCIERLPVDQNGKALSFLPVCHVYERMLHYLYQVTGVSIYFAESMDTIGDNLKEVQPEVFTAVPRLLEKVYDKIIAKGAALTGIKRKLFFWAVSLGEEYDTVGKSGWYKLKLGIARKLIFSKWQAALGGKCKAVASGSAALSPRLARIYLAAGIPVMEGYGLTETSPVVTVNCSTNNMVRIGTVGKPIKDCTVKIAEDGEILVQGTNVMMGYYKQPDLTAETIDAEGWLHTGDIGEFTPEGFLRITDRKKEMFKTSGGKYIAPQPMENKFKESRFIEQIIIIGENQKHPAALVVPAFAFIKDWALRKGITLGSNAEIATNPEVIKRIGEEIDTYNQSFGNWEQVKKFKLLPEEFTIDGGQLTPTLKLKRKIIMKQYQQWVDEIYS